MKIRELREFTRESLKYHQKTAWFMAFSCPAVWLIMKLIPDSMAAALIMQKKALPAEIFFSRNIFWTTFLIFWNLLEFCILIPMLCSVGNWFSEQLGFSRRRYRKFRIKSLWFFGKIQFIRFVVLMPFVLACVLSSQTFQKCAFAEDAGIWLFLTVQCIAAAFWTGIYYLRFCINLLAVPVLFLENPEIPALKAVKLSGKILDGQFRKIFLILCAGGTLPRTLTMLILYLQIRIREYFQEYPQKA